VAFNNHEGSTKSYDYAQSTTKRWNSLTSSLCTRKSRRSTSPVQQVQQHDGSTIVLRKLNDNYDASTASPP
jgi:2-oxoglutarate ferredoxin oxidoreductase subunit beta